LTARRKRLHFIGVMPPDEIGREVTVYKKTASELFNTNRALRSPPHITLIPPFHWDPEDYGALISRLQTVAENLQPFILTLSDFDTFRPRVIFIRIEDSEPLRQLQANTEAALEGMIYRKRKVKRSFHPHMTVATRDLKRSEYPEAWKYFSQIRYQRAFPVKDIVLFRNEEKGWVVLSSVPLG
jgi:2'-5' RNA ligase